jgi:hypothetical protein
VFIDSEASEAVDLGAILGALRVVNAAESGHFLLTESSRGRNLRGDCNGKDNS